MCITYLVVRLTVFFEGLMVPISEITNRLSFHMWPAFVCSLSCDYDYDSIKGNCALPSPVGQTRHSH